MSNKKITDIQGAFEELQRNSSMSFPEASITARNVNLRATSHKYISKNSYTDAQSKLLPFLHITHKFQTM